MKEKEMSQPLHDTDRHIDIPAEANREKHINFLDAEDTGNDNNSTKKDEATKERQKQWQEGLEEGRNARNNEA